MPNAEDAFTASDERSSGVRYNGSAHDRGGPGGVEVPNGFPEVRAR